MKKEILNIKFLIVNYKYVFDIFLQKVYYSASFTKYNKAAIWN